MLRSISTTLMIGLVGLCTAANADPLLIQPIQEIFLDSFGDGGVAVHGSFIFAGIPDGGIISEGAAGAVNIYRKVADSHCNDSPCWIAAGRLQRPDSFAGDRFGASVDFDGHTLVIGSPAASAGDEAAFVYEREGDYFVLQQKLQGPPVLDSRSGRSNFGVTAVLAGDRLAITQLPYFAPGSANVFKRSEHGLWHHEAQLQPAVTTMDDDFGISVDLNSDTLICGSDMTGYATFFHRHGNDWQEGTTIRIPDQVFGGGFGRSVALQGNQAAIGAYFSSDVNDSYLGSEYLFKRHGQDWSQQQELIRPDSHTFASFGVATLLRGDRLAVDSGRGIYVYERRDKQWVLVAEFGSAAVILSTDSLDSMDWNGSTLVAVTAGGIAIFGLSVLDTPPAATP